MGRAKGLLPAPGNSAQQLCSSLCLSLIPGFWEFTGQRAYSFNLSGWRICIIFFNLRFSGCYIYCYFCPFAAQLSTIAKMCLPLNFSCACISAPFISLTHIHVRCSAYPSTVEMCTSSILIILKLKWGQKLATSYWTTGLCFNRPKMGGGCICHRQSMHSALTISTNFSKGSWAWAEHF